MARASNVLLAVLGLAGVIYIIIAALVTSVGKGFARNQDIISLLFPILIVVSLADAGVTIFTQTRWRPMAGRAQYDPVTRVYLIVSTGAILSEAHSVFGLLLTLFSGSIFYLVGFSIVACVSLLWVRARFKQNLARIPHEQ